MVHPFILTHNATRNTTNKHKHKQTNTNKHKQTHKHNKQTTHNVEFDAWKGNTKFQGTAFVPYQFNLEVTSRNGSNVGGQIIWPSLNNSITKWRGTIEGQKNKNKTNTTQQMIKIILIRNK
jgi:hypothetical protein